MLCRDTAAGEARFCHCMRAMRVRSSMRAVYARVDYYFRLIFQTLSPLLLADIVIDFLHFDAIFHFPRLRHAIFSPLADDYRFATTDYAFAVFAFISLFIAGCFSHWLMIRHH